MIGNWKQAQWAREQAQARVQFEKDLKAEQEQQADMDRKIIDKLRNEHELSGTEQDRRLKALEAALKHLKGK
jgi:mRNA-degrading endonuclease YafQ of YafQ-DinJ toxin-antitoxin module